MLKHNPSARAHSLKLFIALLRRILEIFFSRTFVIVQESAKRNATIGLGI